MIEIDMKMPSCCDDCFALDFSGDYPCCIISEECRGYNFNVYENRMPSCPLKEKEPRVLTLNEANAALQKDDVIWVEAEDGHMFGGIRKEDYFEMQDGGLVDFDDLMEPEIANRYGKVYRMWSSRPTDEQREAIPWEK